MRPSSWSKLLVLVLDVHRDVGVDVAQPPQELGPPRHVEAEIDPSHLFSQGIDPVLAVEDLGSLMVVAAAKDTRINDAAKVNGVLDDRFTRFAEGEPATSRWGRHHVSGWPSNSSWDSWRSPRPRRVVVDRVPAGLRDVDPDIPVNIEHEDQELDQLEGLTLAANTLLEAEQAL